jgi:hypothetical protein
MDTLRGLLRSPNVDIGAVEEHLDGLGPAERVEQVRELGKRELAALFELAPGHHPLGLSHLVPRERGPLEEVVHYGKNSLPVFSHFAKVFCRPDDPKAEQTELWGYNRNVPLLETTVGPGYFVAYPHEVQGEILIDYLRVPPHKPMGWPTIVPNHTRLARFVYNGTQEVLRGVSEHVSIGRATKAGTNMDAWFALCREV